MSVRDPRNPEPRRLWLVRHGETTGESSVRFHGRNDVPLSDVGRAQIRALAPLLSGVAFTRVVHSPQVRAAESARILIEQLGLEAGVCADERLREISFGDVEGMTREEIDRAHPRFWADYLGGVIDRFPGGEPRSEFAARVGAVVRELVDGEWGPDLLVVAHRGTVRHAIEALLGVEQPRPNAFGVELASVTVLRSSGAAAGFELEGLGLLP